jgi:hypothetical protein
MDSVSRCIRAISRRIAPGLLAALEAAACADTTMITSPKRGLPVPTAPRVEMQALPPYQAFLSWSPGATLQLPSFPFVEGVRVQLRVEGFVGMTSAAASQPPVNYNGPLDGKGIAVQGVYTGTCYVAALLAYSTIPGPAYEIGPSVAGCSMPRSMDTLWTSRRVVGGNGTAKRQLKVPEYSVPCDTLPGGCHQYSGGQTISVIPDSADLIFRASWNGQNGRTIFVPPFTPSNYYWQVTFTESSTPAGLPQKTLLRNWRKADSTLTGNRTDINECPNYAPPLYPPPNCIINVKESGTMTTTTRVNGVVHIDSACVQCGTPTVDSILDQQVVRTRLINLSNESNPRDPNPNNRIERVTAILRGANGQYRTIDVTIDSANQCKSYWHPLDPAAYPAEAIMAYVHTHPQYKNEKYSCPTPGVSSDGKPGGSLDDWKGMRVVHRLPQYQNYFKPFFYVLANDFVYKLDVSKRRGSDQRPVMRWDKGVCKWIRL